MYSTLEFLLSFTQHYLLFFIYIYSNIQQPKASPSEETASEKKATSDHIFYVGKRFESIAALNEAKTRYEELNFCELWKRDVRTLTSAQKRVPNRVATANLKLEYYSSKFTCKFGGRSVQKREDRKRDSKTFKQGCPFEVYLTLSEDGKALKVTKMTSTIHCQSNCTNIYPVKENSLVH
jgi:hypothetical protein